MVAVDVLVSARLLHDGHASWGTWLLDQLLVLPLLLRRRHPSAVFATIAVVALVQWLAGERLIADVALLVALHGVALRENRRRALVAAAVLEVGVVLAATRFAPTADGTLGSIVFLSGLVAAALLLGTTQQARRVHLASLVDRAERLERERDQQARLAATAERTRIAREMHDIVAHSLSVMVTLADAAAMTRAVDPEASTRAMREVSSTGRRSLDEMRRLLGVLREDDVPAGPDGAVPPPLAPQPGLGQVGELVDRMRGAGLPLTLVVEGRPVGLPATDENAVFRIAQEALTNVLKHSSAPTAVTVRLLWGTDHLVVEVQDDGVQRGDRERSADNASGHGLVGMRERVLVLDGELHAGPHPPGGWLVQARLPLRSPETGLPRSATPSSAGQP